MCRNQEIWNHPFFSLEIQITSDRVPKQSLPAIITETNVHTTIQQHTRPCKTHRSDHLIHNTHAGFVNLPSIVTKMQDLPTSRPAPVNAIEFKQYEMYTLQLWLLPFAQILPYSEYPRPSRWYLGPPFRVGSHFRLASGRTTSTNELTSDYEYEYLLYTHCSGFGSTMSLISNIL